MATLNLGRIKPVFRGAYSGSTAYVVDDIVTHGNESFICIQAHGAGTQATTQGSYWTKLAAKGGDVTQLTTQGDILYRDGSGVARLGAGAAGQALLSGGAGANPSWGTVDLEGIKSDITALAIREATNENSAAFNLPSSFIETFTDDTNLGTQTTGDRKDGFWATVLPTDGIDSNTVLMFHFDNNLTDSSSNGVTLTNNGGATFNTSIKKFGTHSVKLDGTNDYLSTPDLDTVDSSVTTPTTGDYTIDYWLYQVAYTGADRWFSFGNTGTPSTSGAPAGMSFGNGSDGGASVTSWNLYNNTANPASSNTPNYTGLWTHHVAMRKDGHLYILQDGVWKYTSLSSENSGFSTNNMQGGDGTLFIGARMGSTSEYVNGYYDDFRYSNIARYSLTGKSIGDTIYTPRTTAYSGAVANAAGTLIQSANAVSGSRTKVGGTMLYKDNAGTNTLGTDLKIYFTANGGTNWTEAASYNAITPVYSSGVKMVRLGETTVTGGTDVRYKAVFANQALSSKEAQLHAIGINY